MRAAGGVRPGSQTFSPADVNVHESWDKNGRNIAHGEVGNIMCTVDAVKGFESTGNKVHFNLHRGCTRHENTSGERS